jgi:hypothetical protein
LAAPTNVFVELAMTEPSCKQEFLDKARGAQDLADTALNPDARDGWLKVAQGYRKLAAILEPTFKL